jgi:hypothetical protein
MPCSESHLTTKEHLVAVFLLCYSKVNKSQAAYDKMMNSAVFFFHVVVAPRIDPHLETSKQYYSRKNGRYDESMCGLLTCTSGSFMNCSVNAHL